MDGILVGVIMFFGNFVGNIVNGYYIIKYYDGYKY